MQLVAKENEAPICLVLHTYRAIFQGKYFEASLNLDICDMNFMFFCWNYVLINCTPSISKYLSPVFNFQYKHIIQKI
jgi:hypothetical protein